MNQFIIDTIDEFDAPNDSVEYDDVDILNIITTEYPHLTIDLIYTGGFDSTGYSIDCYCVAWIDDNNDLQMHPFTIEHM